MSAAKKKQQKNPFATIAAEFGGDPYGIKEFRKHLGILKKAGLISKKTDVRKQKATRHYLDLIRSLREVIEGKAKTVPVTKAEQPFFEQAGYQQRMGRAVVPVPSPQTKVRKSHSGGFPVVKTVTPARKGAASVTHESVLAPHKDFAAYLEAKVMSAPPEAPGTLYGFKFFGNYSRSLFENRDQLLETFRKYTSLEQAQNRNDPHELDEIYQSFEIVTINSPARDAAFRSERTERKQENARRRAAEQRERRRERERAPSDVQRAAHAEREAERRAALKRDSDPTALLEYREKARLRSQKNRARNKAKKE